MQTLCALLRALCALGMGNNALLSIYRADVTVTELLRLYSLEDKCHVPAAYHIISYHKHLLQRQSTRAHRRLTQVFLISLLPLQISLSESVSDLPGLTVMNR